MANPTAAEVSKPGGRATVQASASTAPAKKKLGPAPDNATNAKVNDYIEVVNEASESFHRVRHDWFSQINPKAGPTCKENVSIEQTIGPDGGSYDAYRKKLKAKPALPPDAAALHMVDAVEELRNIGKEPGPCTEYQGRSQPGSWCRRLKESYPRMLAIFEKYNQGEREVRAYIDNFTDERDLRVTETSLKKHGKHYRFQFATLALEGKRMMRAIGLEVAKDAPNAAITKQRFDSFFALTDEIRATLDKEPPNQKAEPYPNPFGFFLTESVPKIKRASATLLETLAQKVDKKRGERLDGDWRAVVAGYNDMLVYMNQVHCGAEGKLRFLGCPHLLRSRLHCALRRIAQTGTCYRGPQGAGTGRQRRRQHAHVSRGAQRVVTLHRASF